MTTISTPHPKVSERAPSRLPMAGAVALGGLVLWVFWTFLSTQARWAIESQADWGHTLVVPLIAAYFVYLKRTELLSRGFHTAWEGLVLVIGGVGFYTLCTIGPQTLHHHNLQGFGVWTTIVGLTLLFCGWRAMRLLWFPLVYVLVFGQTISETLLNNVTFVMQDIAARGAWFVLYLFLDVERVGNTLYIHTTGGETLPLNIAEACSGMRMLMAFMALGVAMAYTGLYRFWQQAVLVAMGVPTAIFVNILRVVTLGLLALADADFAAGDFHSFIGLLWLVPAFIIYLGVMWAVQKLVIEEDETAVAPVPEASPARKAASDV